VVVTVVVKVLLPPVWRRVAPAPGPFHQL